MSTAEDRPKEDASFAAGARHGPPAACRKDDARGFAPGTLEKKPAVSRVGIPRIAGTKYPLLGCRGVALA
jgi:hypothetical protein